MTDEEKKAIHDLKILRQGIGLLNCIPNIEKDEVDIEAIDTVLNLIEKQSKEIEELKETLKCTQNSWYEDAKIVDKIKAKIEEEKECGSVNGTNEMIIEVLQSLLGKE